MRASCLCCVYIPEDDTGVNLCIRTEEVLLDYNLDKKLAQSITTDAGSNMVKCLEELGMRRMTCLGHVIHNAVTKAINIDSVKRVLGMCRKIVPSMRKENLR